MTPNETEGSAISWKIAKAKEAARERTPIMTKEEAKALATFLRNRRNRLERKQAKGGS